MTVYVDDVRHSSALHGERRMTARLPNYAARAEAILNLRSSEGLSIGLIAERLGEPETFVGNVLTRARAREDKRAGKFGGEPVKRKPTHPANGRARVRREA